MAILNVENLHLRFGGLQVLKSLDFQVEDNAIVSLIGPNGAGKTSVFNCLTGFYRPGGGRMKFGGQNLSRLKPHHITKAGIARTFQNLRLFKGMTTLQNVKSGMHCRTGAGILAAIFRPPAQRAEEAEITRVARECLAFVGLSGQEERVASNLPYGDQRRVEWARALATKPRLLLLDEPAAGLNNTEKRELIALMRRIRDELGITILLIEHDMGLVMQVSEHIIVLDYGEKIAEGPAHVVKHDPRVIEAYLGTEEG